MTAPVLWLSAYTDPSSEPMYTTPLAMVGDDSTAPPVVLVHSSAPVVSLKAFTAPPCEPTTTVLPTIAG